LTLPQSLQDRREERRLEGHIEEIGAKFRPRMAAAKTEREEYDIDQEWTFEVEGVSRQPRCVEDETAGHTCEEVGG